MTDLPRDPHWSEFDPEEKPVPLDAARWVAADDAELIVNVERQELIRQDTEPTTETLVMLAGRQVGDADRSGPRLNLTVAVALLIAGCIAMFLLGWRQGESHRQAVEGAMGPHSISGYSRNDDVIQNTVRPSLMAFSGGSDLATEEGETK